LAARLRILHTADWHLGHALALASREAEHRAFLSWLAETLVAEAVDALLVAGDVFDTANPPASAQAAWYGFLAEAWRRRPGLQVVCVGGNHDSPSRLDAPEPLLRAFGGRVVGALPRTEAGALDLERIVVPLRDASGETAAWCVAMPFLRVSDLPPAPAISDAAGISGDADPLIEGVRAVYAEAFTAARARLRPGQALLAMGHLYMAGTALSELSERKILGGNLHALPSEIFPADVAYTALGHLHRPQSVGGRDHVRYSGSPVALSMPEGAHGHEVVLVDLEGGAVTEIRRLPVPLTRRLVRIPAGAALPLADALAAIALLEPRAPGDVEDAWPLVEVRVRLDAPDPSLKKRVDEALESRRAHLVRLGTEYTGHGRALADGAPGVSLDELSPEQVFRRRWARDYADAAPPADLLAAFHEVLEEAHRGAPVAATAAAGAAP